MQNLILFFVFLSFFLSFSVATPLDETFKDIEVSGALRYRYEMQKSKKYDKKSQKHQKTTLTKITIN